MFVAWLSFMLALWVMWWLVWAFQETCLGCSSVRRYSKPFDSMRNLRPADILPIVCSLQTPRAWV